MTLPTLDTIVAYTTICFAIFGALLAALWLSLIIWTFRDMRSRSRDPFAQILSALVVALLPGIGLVVYLILRPPETLAEAYERALEEEALLQEIEDRPTCPGCSRVVNQQWILCPHCHTRLHKACPHCNNLMELHWNLCPYCGSQQVDVYASSSLRADVSDGDTMSDVAGGVADYGRPAADDGTADGLEEDPDSAVRPDGAADEA